MVGLDCHQLFLLVFYEPEAKQSKSQLYRDLMALDMVLRGASSTRLATILTSIHGEGIAKMVRSAIDAENHARGVDSWIHVEGQSIEHQENVQVLSQASFELPEETLSAGDEVVATIAPAPQSTASQASRQQSVEKLENKDPFAISDTLNKPDKLASGFKKNNASSSDVTNVAFVVSRTYTLRNFAFTLDVASDNDTDH